MNDTKGVRTEPIYELYNLSRRDPTVAYFVHAWKRGTLSFEQCLLGLAVELAKQKAQLHNRIHELVTVEQSREPIFPFPAPSAELKESLKVARVRGEVITLPHGLALQVNPDAENAARGNAIIAERVKKIVQALFTPPAPAEDPEFVPPAVVEEKP